MHRSSARRYHRERQANACRSPGEIALARRRSADQAVIAIENARLFDEVQARTRDLEEALQQQTATADVLKVISRSAFDLADGARDAGLDRRSRLCDAQQGSDLPPPRRRLSLRASQMAPSIRRIVAHEQTAEIKAGRGTLDRRVALGERTVEDRRRLERPGYSRERRARVGNVRAMLGVPLLRNGELIGAFVLARASRFPSPTPDRARHDLRRPGGDRDRERAPVRRGAGAHARPRGGAASSRRRPPTS